MLVVKIPPESRQEYIDTLNKAVKAAGFNKYLFVIDGILPPSISFETIEELVNALTTNEGKKALWDELLKLKEKLSSGELNIDIIEKITRSPTGTMIFKLPSGQTVGIYQDSCPGKLDIELTIKEFNRLREMLIFLKADLVRFTREV